jgi:hypothetical protein
VVVLAEGDDEGVDVGDADVGDGDGDGEVVLGEGTGETTVGDGLGWAVGVADGEGEGEAEVRDDDGGRDGDVVAAFVDGDEPRAGAGRGDGRTGEWCTAGLWPLARSVRGGNGFTPPEYA